MAHAVEYIEGIGDSYGARLRRAGIRTTLQLLRACADRKGRREVAEKTGIDEARLLKWANMADLMRIRGIGRQYAELLEAAGVDTVKALQVRDPADLAAKMRQVNGQRRVCRALPPESLLRRWIEQAKALPPVMDH
jgi:predicted flap endonuclease-1-like 5' DNA nuclease